MSQEYEPDTSLSTDTVTPSQWRITLLLTSLIIIGGSLLVVLLALGVADPPRAGKLLWQTESTNGWELRPQSDDLSLLTAPILLAGPPFTLELSAENSGAHASAWGIWLSTADGVWSLLINNEGYLSVGVNEKPHWAEFLHIRRNSDNKLYLNVESDGLAAIRINDEIAWEGMVNVRETWGIVLYCAPHLAWQTIEIYAP
jgi:hypothetical protein